MRQFAAFLKKEWLEQVRTGRFWILLILFVLFGISSPALAKMTPWLYDMLASSLEEQGGVIQNMTVTALTSWQQFYKNVSMLLVILVVMSSGVLTNEYRQGTLINVLTKGIPRWKVLAAKTAVQVLLWSICFFSAFFITYGYTAYFWDNGAVSHWLLAGMLTYVLGIWLLSLIFLGSVLLESNLTVILFVGAAVVVCYLAGMFPAVSDYMPVKLLEVLRLLEGTAETADFYKALGVTLSSSLVFFGGAAAGFNKTRI